MSRRPGWTLRLRGSRRARRWKWALLRLRLPVLPPLVWVLLGLVALIAVNYLIQVVRKPTEILGFVVPTTTKSPRSTWTQYGPLFRAHSTEIMQPELLAALVQAESAGDPLARTYWRWRLRSDPWEIYAPASSAVGILQITDGTYEEARRFCIHHHQVAQEGSWRDPRACWFNRFYFRTVPSHAIEMTSARLHHVVVDLLADQGAAGATMEQKRRLAVVIHLCGRERGAHFARRGFRAFPGERCGAHDLDRYLSYVLSLRDGFVRVRADG